MKDKKNKKEKKKLKISDIKKYSRIDIGHTIEKIKLYEREMTVITVGIMIIIILLILLIVGTSFNKINEYNIYEDDGIVVKYDKYEDGYSDVITLDKDDVVSDKIGLNGDSHNFRVYNRENNSIKISVLLEIDEEIIELEDCYNLFVNDNAIRYSFNGKKVNNLFDSKKEMGYVLEEDFIDANQYKDYSLNMWINNEDIMNKKHNHFHGKILVKIAKKY